MKVLVVDFAASERGALSILKEYYDEISNDKDNEYYFLLNDYYIEEKSNIHVIKLNKYKNWICRLYFDLFKGRKIINKIKPDIVLSLQNTIIKGINIKQILYMHQSIPFQNIKKFSFFKKEEVKLAIIQNMMSIFIKSSIKNADKIIVQTNWIKESIIKKLNILPNKIEVINPNVKISEPIKSNGIKYNRFFYPTSDEVYKNNNIFYEVCDLLNKDGITNYSVELTIDGFSNNNINKIGKIDREDVFKKYSESILVFPSYIETYGLPLLEARKSNAIIFASDTPFSHEILDGYENAYFFNPFSPVELKELMIKSINNEIKVKKSNKIIIHNSKAIKDVLEEQNSLKDILWLTNIPSPYRVNFFNEFGKLVNLHVGFERNSSSERDKSWQNYMITSFDYSFMHGIKYGIDKSISLNGIKLLKKHRYDYIFISNYSSITGLILAAFMIINKKKYIIETDGGFAKTGNGLKERIKKIIISNAYKCFSTSKEGDNYYLHYGAEKSKIIRYPFTSLYKNDIIDKPLNFNDKKRLKQKYNVKENKIIISIGRFVPCKGFDILLNSYSLLDNNDYGLYIIGGTPTNKYLDIIAKYDLKNVHFLPFMSKEQIFDYLKLSDLFVLATRGEAWGLVINEAMACGLPVITTNKCIAGLELITNNKNGFIVNVDDYKTLAYKINKILENEKLRSIISSNNIKKIKNYTFEEMAKVHLKDI